MVEKGLTPEKTKNQYMGQPQDKRAKTKKKKKGTLKGKKGIVSRDRRKKGKKTFLSSTSEEERERQVGEIKGGPSKCKKVLKDAEYRKNVKKGHPVKKIPTPGGKSPPATIKRG